MYALHGHEVDVSAARELHSQGVDYYNDEIEPTEEEYAALRK
jgi:hypothetical protein